ncbi:hypothetical protein Tco_0373120 [Tanacetum coccineum]
MHRSLMDQPLQDPYDAPLLVGGAGKQHVQSSHDFHCSCTTAPLGIRRRSATLIRPGRQFPFGPIPLPHPNLTGPPKLLTCKEEELDFTLTRLASRPCITSSPESALIFFPVHPSILCQFILWDWMRQIRLIRDLRLEMYHPDCVTLRGEHHDVESSERPMHLSPHSAGPSRKRCRSPVDSAPLSMPVTGSLAPTSLLEKKSSHHLELRVDMELCVSVMGMSWISCGLTIGNSKDDLRKPAGRIPPDVICTRDVHCLVQIVRIETGSERDRMSSLRLHMSLSQEEFRQIRRDRDGSSMGRLKEVWSRILGRRFGFRP